MGHSTTELPSGLHSSRDQIVLASILALVAGAGLCIAFATGFWVRGLIDRDVGQSGQAGPELTAAGRPVTAHLGPPPAVRAERVEPGRPAKTPAVAAAPTTPPAKAAPLAAAAAKRPPDRPVRSVRDQASTLAAPERFVLRQPARRTSLPFVLPEKPSFALADLKLDEPAEACGQTAQVCAVDRSLNTALTWAKSPGAASEQARTEGKLVFVIHVSGNFEDPGFT
jgi:hypothetical protein